MNILIYSTLILPYLFYLCTIPKTFGLCMNNEEPETLSHFIVKCPKLQAKRNPYVVRILKELGMDEKTFVELNMTKIILLPHLYTQDNHTELETISRCMIYKLHETRAMRKRLRSDVSRLFEGISDKILTDMVPGNKVEMTLMKIYTHAGDTVTVYCVCKNPIFFATKEQLYPTVYTLWKYPDLVPVFTTWPPVLKNLQDGADLMTPGIIVKGEKSMNCLGKIQKGALYAINLANNRNMLYKTDTLYNKGQHVFSRAAISIGRTSSSSDDMYMAGMRGKAVLIAHTYKDQLWALGDRSDPPELGIPNVMLEIASDLPESIHSQNDAANESEETEKHYDKNLSTENNDFETKDLRSAIENLDTCSDSSHQNNPIPQVQVNEDTNSEDQSLNKCSAPSFEVDELTELNNPQVTMDKLLYGCFLYALKAKVNKSDLPILTSTFFSHYMKSCCPHDKSLDIKKSSFKKFSKFIHEMQQKQLITVKELSKGVESIMEINRAHPDVRRFKVPDIPMPEENENDDDDDDDYTPPDIVDMFNVNGATMHFFRGYGFQKGSTLSAADLRKVVTEYVKANNLIDSQNKSQVILDGILTDLVLNKAEEVTHVKWDDLFDRIIGKMNPMHLVSFPGKEPQLHKGKVEPIKASIAQRGGNKRVSFIENLEPFGIDPHKFAHEIQINLACSTSVTQLPGKNRGFQVLIQGNQLAYVLNLLRDNLKKIVLMAGLNITRYIGFMGVSPLPVMARHHGKYEVKEKYLQGFDKAIKSKKSR